MIAVESLTMIQGAFLLDAVSFTVPTGQYGVLMGSTGSGKSSVLEAIAGLRPITDGRIALGDVEVTFSPPNKRDIGYVPQDGALFQTMTIEQHLSFGMWLRKKPKVLIQERVQELATWLGIEHLLDRRPVGLSGGEAQRVALGRALSYKPRYLLLDEPLSALDEATRYLMVQLLNQLRQTRQVTVLHVTHSSSEAEQLADVIFRLNQGKLVGEQA
jgi:molybdate/tungstate transport system ATP-binding protein